jgi:hypothetical protein
MSAEPAQLHICSGLHQGARTSLVRGQRLVLGSGEACDIRLLDPGIETQHLALEPRARRLHLHALAPGVRVRNKDVRQGRRAALRRDEEIHIAAVTLRYEPPAAKAWSGLSATWPATWPAMAGHGRTRIAIALGAAALGSAVLAAWPGAHSHGDNAVGPRPDSEGSRVRRQIDAASGRPVYSGHVPDERALALLRTRVHQQGETAALFRIAVRTRVLQAVDEVLSHHYAVSRLTELQPGRYRIVTGGPASYLDDTAWDAAAVAREIQHAVRGVASLEFREDPALMTSGARLPLSAPPWSLVSTPHGQWISDGSQRRYFEGAQLSNGRVVDLARCSVRLIDGQRKRIVHYSGEAGGGSCY